MVPALAWPVRPADDSWLDHLAYLIVWCLFGGRCLLEGVQRLLHSHSCTPNHRPLLQASCPSSFSFWAPDDLAKSFTTASQPRCLDLRLLLFSHTAEGQVHCLKLCPSGRFFFLSRSSLSKAVVWQPFTSGCLTIHEPCSSFFSSGIWPH